MSAYGNGVISTPVEDFRHRSDSRPPVKQGLGAHALGLLGQPNTRVRKHGVERGQVSEGAVRPRRVGPRPPPLRRLAFGRLRRQPCQVHAGRDLHLRTAVPAGLVHHEQARLVRPGSHLLGEVRQRAGAGGKVARRQQPPMGRPRLWLPEAVDVLPLVAGAYDGPGARAPSRPDPPPDGL
jgi:hypothetical protein